MSITMRIREDHNGPVLFERAFGTEAEYQQVADLCIDREPIDFSSEFFAILLAGVDRVTAHLGFILSDSTIQIPS